MARAARSSSTRGRQSHRERLDLPRQRRGLQRRWALLLLGRRGAHPARQHVHGERRVRRAGWRLRRQRDPAVPSRTSSSVATRPPTPVAAARWARRTASISGARVLDNVATANAGGGLYVNSGGPAPVFSSTFSGNRVDDGDGGGPSSSARARTRSRAAPSPATLIGGVDAQGGGLLLASGEQSQILTSPSPATSARTAAAGSSAAATSRSTARPSPATRPREGGAIYNGSLVRHRQHDRRRERRAATAPATTFDSGNRNIDTDGSCELDGPSDQDGRRPAARAARRQRRARRRPTRSRTSAPPSTRATRRLPDDRPARPRAAGRRQRRRRRASATSAPTSTSTSAPAIRRRSIPAPAAAATSTPTTTATASSTAW